MISNLGHVGIICDDFLKMRDFYTRVLSLTVTDVNLPGMLGGKILRSPHTHDDPASGWLPPDLQPWPLTDMDFVTSCSLVPPDLPPIRFLFVESRLCSTLPSDLASRRRPCASLTLLLVRMGRGLSPPSCRSCPAHKNRGSHLSAYPVSVSPLNPPGKPTTPFRCLCYHSFHHGRAGASFKAVWAIKW